VFGLVPTPSLVLFHHRIDSILGEMNRTKPALERARWKEHDCYIIRYTNLMKSKPKVAIWVVPSMDHSVVRIEVESSSDGDHSKTWIESDLKRYGKAGIWYPTSCTYANYKNGNLHQRELIEISEATLNEPIAPDTFRMIGMDIPPGTPVSGSALPPRRHLWDGRAIVRQAMPAVPESPPPQSSANRSLLLVAGLVLMFVATTFVYLFFRKRKAPVVEA
jgi:hypothetical protein